MPEPAVAAEVAEDTETGAPLGDTHEPSAASKELIQRAPLPRGVAPYVLSDDELRLTWRAASALATSGIFKDATKASVEVAFAKVMIGRDLGISPTQALMTIDLVKGSIQLRGVLLASFVRRSRDYEYRIVEKTHEKARVQLLGFPTDEKADDLIRHRGQWWELLGEEEFTVEDAKRAGLYKQDSNWQKYPKNMCVWRALSNAVRFHAPDLLGGVPAYVEGEVIPEPQLGEGQGDGQPAGLDLGPDVEAVIARATELGHAGLSDRGTIEMQLGDQPPAKVAEWVKAAYRVLDDMPVDAEVVDGEPADALSGDLSGEAAQTTEPPQEAQSAPQEPAAAGEAGESAPVDPERIAALRERANDLLYEADELRDSRDLREAEVREEAERLQAEIEAADDPAQARWSL